MVGKLEQIIIGTILYFLVAVELDDDDECKYRQSDGNSDK